MLYFGQRGYRVIAHDRRGHGRSNQTWDGNDMDTYADDLAQLFEKLDLKDAIMVGHSTGGGEVARYLGRHGTKRVAKAALISAVPPLMLKTEKNPTGAPIEVFDGLRAALAANRPQFYKDITLPFYGYNRPGAKISEGIREHWWLQGMMGGMKAPLRLHQGVFGDGLHRRPEEDRHPRAGDARRGRSDCAHRSCGSAFGEIAEEFHAEDLSGVSAWHAGDKRGCRSTGICWLSSGGKR